MQLDEQTWNHFNQLGGLLERHFAFNAPYQIRHHRAVSRRVDLAAGVHQPRMCHHQRPSPKQKIQHLCGHLLQIGAARQLKRKLIGIGLALFGKMQRLQHLLAFVKVIFVLIAPNLQKICQSAGKGLRVNDGCRVESLKTPTHFAKKFSKFVAELVVEIKAALRDPLHQRASRMTLVAKKAGVNQRQSQQRWL